MPPPPSFPAERCPPLFAPMHMHMFVASLRFAQRRVLGSDLPVPIMRIGRITGNPMCTMPQPAAGEGGWRAAPLVPCCPRPQWSAPCVWTRRTAQCRTGEMLAPAIAVYDQGVHVACCTWCVCLSVPCVRVCVRERVCLRSHVCICVRMCVCAWACSNGCAWCADLACPWRCLRVGHGPACSLPAASGPCSTRGTSWACTRRRCRYLLCDVRRLAHAARQAGDAERGHERSRDAMAHTLGLLAIFTGHRRPWRMTRWQRRVVCRTTA